MRARFRSRGETFPRFLSFEAPMNGLISSRNDLVTLDIAVYGVLTFQQKEKNMRLPSNVVLHLMEPCCFKPRFGDGTVK